MTGIPTIGLLLGDPAGIGPQLSARLLANPPTGEYRLIAIGRKAWLQQGAVQARIPEPEIRCLSLSELVPVPAEEPVLVELDDQSLDSVPVATIGYGSGAACISSLQTAVGLCKLGILSGFVYGPMHKQSLRAGGSNHADDAGLLSELFDIVEPAHEINILDEWCTSRVTSHIPLSQVPAHISAPSVLTAIEHLHAVMRGLGLTDIRMGVAGLNPHAGEGGMFGDEETEVIEPAISLAQERGIPVTGPFPPDTLFVRLSEGQFGGVVTMYHDQGQIAIKLLGFARGVTVIGGLPVPVATTAHGTAFDIVEAGTARPESLKNAVSVCSKLASPRLASAHRQGN